MRKPKLLLFADINEFIKNELSGQVTDKKQTTREQ